MKFFTSAKYNAIMIVMAVTLIFISDYDNIILLHTLSWLFMIYFILEAVFKIKDQGWVDYISSFWNFFDFSIVIVSVIILLTQNDSIGGVIYLRIFRILTLAKLIRFIPNSEHIIRGLIRAIKASQAILIMLAIMLIFFSLLGFTLFSDVIPVYFGDPLRSMNTIFMIFTIENWGIVPDEARHLNQDYHYYAVNAFVITVLVLGGFIALSLANAILVDEMVSDNNDPLIEEIELLKKELSDIKEILRNR